MVFLLSCLARYIFPRFSIFLEVMCFYFAHIVNLTCFGFNMLIIYLLIKKKKKNANYIFEVLANKCEFQRLFTAM
jgi:hypothetical protein